MNREFGIFADWKPLTDAGKTWIERWKPNLIYLGLTDDGLTMHGASRPRNAWGAKWSDRIARDVRWLEVGDIEAAFCVWYDYSKRTNDDLLEWLPNLIMRTGVRTIALNCEYAAKKSVQRSENDTRLHQRLVDMGCRVEIAAYSVPIPGVVRRAESEAQSCGLLHYLPEAYSHYPPGKDDDHWTRARSWRPGVAQLLAWEKAPKGGAWGEPVMGVGVYYLRGHGQAPRISLREMLHASPARIVAAWSLKWCVGRGRDWIGEELSDWRSPPRE